MKINWCQNFKWVLFIIVAFSSCQAELSEDEKFDRFAEQYEKMVVRVFPETTDSLDIDSLVSKDLTKQEILKKVEFCRENLDKLSNFDLEKISPENTAQLKQIFTAVKTDLRKMELAAQNVVD